MYDMLREARPPVLLYPVLTTAGHATTYDKDTREVHVPKSEQVSLAQVLIQGDLLNWSPKLAAATRLKDQLLRYKVKITKAKNETFGAEQGANDDLVSAVMTACYIAEHFGGGRVSQSSAAGADESAVGGAPDGVFATGKGV